MTNVKRLSSVAIVATFAMMLGSVAMAKEVSPQAHSDSIRLSSLNRIHSWKAVSRNEIVLSISPFKSYLVTLSTPFNGLRFAQAIGVTTMAGRISRFDAILVEGRRLPIESIVEIDRETARSMRWRAKHDDV